MEYARLTLIVIVSALLGALAVPAPDTSIPPRVEIAVVEKDPWDEGAWCQSRVDSYALAYNRDPGVGRWKSLGWIMAYCKDSV